MPVSSVVRGGVLTVSARWYHSSVSIGAWVAMAVGLSACCVSESASMDRQWAGGIGVSSHGVAVIHLFPWFGEIIVCPPDLFRVDRVEWMTVGNGQWLDPGVMRAYFDIWEDGGKLECVLLVECDADLSDLYRRVVGGSLGIVDNRETSDSYRSGLALIETRLAEARNR